MTTTVDLDQEVATRFVADVLEAAGASSTMLGLLPSTSSSVRRAAFTYSASRSPPKPLAEDLLLRQKQQRELAHRLPPSPPRDGPATVRLRSLLGTRDTTRKSPAREAVRARGLQVASALRVVPSNRPIGRLLSQRGAFRPSAGRCRTRRQRACSTSTVVRKVVVPRGDNDRRHRLRHPESSLCL